MNALSTLESSPILNGLTIVDADTHISEWPDLWTARAPSKYKDRVPVLKEHDGRLVWLMEGNKSLGVGSPVSAIKRDGSKSIGMEFLEWTLPEVHRGAWNIESRIEYMDATGVTAQIAYPNVLGFGGQKAMQFAPDLRVLCVQIYNDAMAEVQERSGNRIFPMALLPWWDVKLAVAEAERCADMGMRGVNTNSDPHMHDLPDLGDEYWYPLWEVLSDRGLPVNFHIGASDESLSWTGTGRWPSFDSNTGLAYGSAMLFLSNARVLANIILSRFLEKFPKLKLVSVESGVGWVPFLLEALEYQMHETGQKFELTPWEIFERQIYGCSWFESRNFAETARQLGTKSVLFETDFPHPTCLYPDVIGKMEQAGSKLEPDERVDIFGANAVRVYNLPIEI